MKTLFISVIITIATISMLYSQSFEQLNSQALEYYNKGYYTVAIEFAEKALKQAEYEFGNEHQYFTASLNLLGILYMETGDYVKAERFFIMARYIRKNAVGVYDSDYFSFTTNLLLLYQKTGNYSKAEPIYIEVLDIIKNALGTDQPSYASFLNSLADLYVNMGDYQKAEPLFLHSLDIQKRLLGTNNPDYAASLSDLGSLYNLKGEYTKAEPLLTDALIIIKKSHGTRSSEYATALNNLASLYVNMGLYTKAEQLYIEASEVLNKVNEKDNPGYAAILNNLADLYRAKGNYVKAEQLFIEASSIIKKTGGQDNPDYASSINNLGLIYIEMGKYEKAEPLFKEASAIFKKVLGPEHPNYANTLNNLALLYDKVGDYSRAEPLYIDASAIYKKAFGPEHPAYVTSLSNLAVLYFEMGNWNKAEQLYINVSNILINTLGPEHPDYITSLNLLAEFYFRTGNFSSAEPLLIEVANEREKLLGINHPDYATALNNLAMLFQVTGDYAQAERLLREAIDIRKNSLGTEHPDYLISISSLAGLYFNMGNYANAEPLFIEALSNISKKLRPDHPNYIGALSNLALLYDAMDNYPKADTLFIQLNNNLNNQIYNYFNFLSETEKEQFFNNTIKYYFMMSNSFFLKSKKQNPSITSVSYNNELVLKGMLLLSNTAIRQAIYGSHDGTVINMYDQLINIHNQLYLLYTSNVYEKIEKIDSLENIANKVEKELIVKGKDLPGIEDLTGLTSTRWQDVQTALKPGEAAIEFINFNFYNKRWTDSIFYCALVLLKDYQYPKMIYLFEEKQLHKIISTSQAIDNSNYIAQLYGNVPEIKSADSQASNDNNLYQLIWQPIDSLLKGINTIYIAPSGLLHKISFSAIPVSVDTILLDKYNINTVSSTRILAQRDPTFATLSVNYRAALYGGIKYEMDSTEIVSLSRQYHKNDNDYLVSRTVSVPEDTLDFKWSELPGTYIEVSDIHELLKSKQITTSLYTGGNATEESFKHLTDSILSPEIIHIASHGFYFPVIEFKVIDMGNIVFRGGISSEPSFIYSLNPLLRSGILLAGANRSWRRLKSIHEVEDGILTAYEVSKMNLSNTKLVVLSACETGLGDIKQSEGVYGLQRAFKLAGAQYIIMSLWKIPDSQTSEMMQFFYTNLLNGMTINDAFKVAQQTMHKKYDPFYWAGFILVE